MMLFQTMLRCSWEEPAVFREFVNNYPDSLQTIGSHFGFRAQDANVIVAAAKDPNATSTSIKAVYDQQLSYWQRANFGANDALVSTSRGILAVANGGKIFIDALSGDEDSQIEVLAFRDAVNDTAKMIAAEFAKDPSGTTKKYGSKLVDESKALACCRFIGH